MIIGMMGSKGSGKNTVADIICKLDPSFQSVAFADTLKDIVSILFNWKRDMVEGKTLESRKWREEKDLYWSECLGRDFTPRMALQEIGTNVLRDHFCKDIWVNALKYKLIGNPNKNFIITDVRFKNEIDMLKHLGTTFVEVRRPPYPKYWQDAFDYNNDRCEFPESLKNVHPSEWDWIGSVQTNVVYNNGSLIELEYNVQEMLKKNKILTIQEQ